MKKYKPMWGTRSSDMKEYKCEVKIVGTYNNESLNLVIRAFRSGLPGPQTSRKKKTKKTNLWRNLLMNQKKIEKLSKIMLLLLRISFLRNRKNIWFRPHYCFNNLKLQRYTTIQPGYSPSPTNRIFQRLTSKRDHKNMVILPYISFWRRCSLKSDLGKVVTQ